MQAGLKSIVDKGYEHADRNKQCKRDHGQAHQSNGNPESGAPSNKGGGSDADDGDIRNYEQDGPSKLLDVAPGGTWRTTLGYGLGSRHRAVAVGLTDSVPLHAVQ